MTSSAARSEGTRETPVAAICLVGRYKEDNAELTALQRQVDELTRNLVSVTYEKDQLSAASRSLEENLKIAKEKAAHTEIREQELSAARSERDELARLVRELKAAAKPVDKCPPECSSSVAMTKEQLQHLKSQIDTLTTQVASQKGIIARLGDEMRGLNRQMQDLRKDYADSERLWRYSEKEKVDLTSYCDQLEQDCKIQRTRSRSQSVKIFGLERQVSEVLREKEHFSRLLEENSSRIAFQTTRILELEFRMEEMRRISSEREEKLIAEISALRTKQFMEDRIKEKTAASSGSSLFSYF